MPQILATRRGCKPVPNRICAGIDIGLESNVASFIDQDGNDLTRKPLRFDNNLDGLEAFLKTLSEITTKVPCDLIEIGMEATGLYWWHLWEALSSSPKLNPIPCNIYILNPSLVKGFKKAFTIKPKTDIVDAKIIAERVRFGKLNPVTPNDLKLQPLARLTRLRYHLVRSATSDKHRAIELLFLKFPEYRKVAGKRLLRKASLSLLDEFTPDELLAIPTPELAKFLVDNGNARFKEPDAFAEAVKTAAARSYRLNPKMESTVDIALSMVLENIDFFTQQIKKLDKAIEREMRAIPNPLVTVPGIGPVISAGIVAEIGDIARFHDQGALARFAGLTWHKHQTGSFDAEETSLTKAGNEYLRYYLVEGANSLRLHNKEYAAYYRRKYEEVPKHQHKRALVLTARKFVRLVFALLSKGQIYRDRR